MADSCGADAIVTIGTNLVTWLLVVFGWLVINDQGVESEAAKNSYSRMNRLRGDLSRLEADAVEHHTDGYDEKRVRSILRGISMLGMEITQLVKTRNLGGGALAMVTELRQAVTADNFDVGDYEKQSATADVIQQIEVTKDQLDRLLMEAADTASVTRRTLRESLSATFKRLF